MIREKATALLPGKTLGTATSAISEMEKRKVTAPTSCRMVINTWVTGSMIYVKGLPLTNGKMATSLKVILRMI